MCSNISIIFFALKISTIFFLSPKGVQAQAPLKGPKYAPVCMGTCLAAEDFLLFIEAFSVCSPAMMSRFCDIFQFIRLAVLSKAKKIFANAKLAERCKLFNDCYIR